MKQLYKSFLLFVSLSICFLSKSFAQPGALDLTLGNGGKVMTTDNTNSSATAISIQVDGKIVMGSSSRAVNGTLQFALFRFKTDGNFDSSFGTAGKVVTAIGINAGINDIALQPDGKIIAAGFSDSAFVYNSNFTVARYNTDGSLDTSFGNGGIVLTNFSLGSTYINKVLVKPDGKILVGGTLSAMTFEYYVALAQYLPNGKADSTFGINGALAFYPSVMNGNGSAKGITDMALTADGKILAVVEGEQVPVTNGSDFLLYRFLPDGSADSSFGTNGLIETDFANTVDISYGLTVNPDSSIVVVGLNFSFSSPSVNRFALVKYHANGTLDNTFGNGGKVITQIDNYQARSVKVIADSSGKLFVGGYTWHGNMDKDFVLAAYYADGSPYFSFGRHGYVITDFANTQDHMEEIAMQADGKIILAGKSLNSSNNNYFSLSRYERNSKLNYNTLKGSVFADRNGDGIKQANEPYYNNARLISTSASGDSILFYTSTGKFQIDIDTVVTVTQVVNMVQYYTSVPSSFTTNHSTYFNTDSISFAVQPIPGKRDISVTIIPLSPTRPGFQCSYKMVCTNVGTDTLPSGYVGFLKDSRLTYVSASTTPLYINGDSIVWNISNLKPMQEVNIIIECAVKLPPIANVNDTLHSAGIIYPVSGDLAPDNNVSMLSQKVTGSYDPNDKSEKHGGSIKITEVAGGTYLEYTIRFQNTGNDTAFNVYIRDTLDSKLDWSTFAMVATSHNYQLVINDQAKCLWTFNGINLPDSTRSKPSSHGFITFIIKPKSNLVLGDIIANKASIYFDYNLPIVTNTEKTKVVAQIFPLNLLSFTAKRTTSSLSFGEGRGEVVLNWTTTNEVNVSHFEIERSSNGSEFLKVGSVKCKVESGSQSLYDYFDPINNQLSTITNLYYRLKMVDKDGQFTYSPIRLVNISISFEVSFFPNPTKEKLQVKIDSYKKAIVQCQIVSQEGKIILSRSYTLTDGANQVMLPVANLPVGQYFLSIISTDKEQSVLKFEKL